MPKYYCDYCDTYLTHDSPSVRKTHCEGRKHKDNVKFYYQNWLAEQTQNLIDTTTAAFKAGKIALPAITGAVPVPRLPHPGMSVVGQPPPGMSVGGQPPRLPPPGMPLAGPQPGQPHPGMPGAGPPPQPYMMGPMGAYGPPPPMMMWPPHGPPPPMMGVRPPMMGMRPPMVGMRPPMMPSMPPPSVEPTNK